MKIGITNDHRGYSLKIKLIKYLTKKGHEVTDLGAPSTTSVDYPEYAFILGEKVANQELDLGIAICGSGIGISIASNKVKGIRCAKPFNAKESKLSRQHNDANILALSASMSYFRILDILDAFLTTKFSNVERHQNRINQITEYETPKKKTRIKKETSKEDEVKENEC